MAFPEYPPPLKLGLRYEERKKDPPPGLAWHKVDPTVDGNTLATLAANYGVRWVDIALYNFRTDDLGEINWYLHHFVGCKHKAGSWYTFKGGERLLVPGRPPKRVKPPKRIIDAGRDTDNKRDMQVHVQVVERTAAGSSNTVVSGKWLYVFSASDGADFGHDPSRGRGFGMLKEFGVLGPQLPETAFKLAFPGNFPIRGKPDKLECEIYVTAEDPASGALIKEIGSGKTSRYKIGNHWHFITDQQVLAKATVDPRHTRTDHAFRDEELVRVELDGKRRYYFLLSPVQLGPVALKYAMSHPRGLTPLLKPAKQADPPKDSDPPSPTTFIGPGPEDVPKSGVITLPVIDPYAWAEQLVPNYLKAIAKLQQWLDHKGGDNTGNKKGDNTDNKSKSQVIKALEGTTLWTTKHYYIARVLKIIDDAPGYKGDIKDQLYDPATWNKHLAAWEEGLVKENARINALVHSDMAEIMNWMWDDPHEIIEQALRSDTNAGSLQDALDLARGIIHWAMCTRFAMAVQPGVRWLQRIFQKKDTFLYEKLLRHLDQLDSNAVSDVNALALRMSLSDVLQITGIRDLVTNVYKLPLATSHEAYVQKLAGYAASRRDAFLKFVNGLKLAPFQLQGLPPALDRPKDHTVFANWAPVTNSLLDLGDRIVAWRANPGPVPKIRPHDPDWDDQHHSWSRRNKYFEPTAKFSNWMTVKTPATLVNLYNTYQLFAVWLGSDQQVKGADIAAAVSGLYSLFYDVATEFSPRLFPALISPKDGRFWHFTPAAIETTFGKVAAGLNVAAIIITGVATVYAMWEGMNEASKNGEYTAAGMYFVAMMGGVMTVTGGLILGYTLIKAGAAAAWVPTVGFFLMLAGTVVAAVFNWLAKYVSLDDYEKFAVRCFLGKLSNPELRRNPPFHLEDPPSIEQQYLDLGNLLRRFVIFTELLAKIELKKTYTGDLRIEITPGPFPPGSKTEVALHYGKDGTKTAITLRWSPKALGNEWAAERIAVKDGKLFNPHNSSGSLEVENGSPKRMFVLLKDLHYVYSGDLLYTTVTMTFPPDDWPTVMKAMKPVTVYDMSSGVFGSIGAPGITNDAGNAVSQVSK